jgi:hypothetical protein
MAANVGFTSTYPAIRRRHVDPFDRVLEDAAILLLGGAQGDLHPLPLLHFRLQRLVERAQFRGACRFSGP